VYSKAEEGSWSCVCILCLIPPPTKPGEKLPHPKLGRLSYIANQRKVGPDLPISSARRQNNRKYIYI
jgi:hypothetical protein